MGRKTQISLFDGTDTTYQIKKHSSMTQMANFTSMMERKVMNPLIRIARDVLKRNPGATSFSCEIGLIKRLAGLGDSDNKQLKLALISLRNTSIEYNIFKKDKKKTWWVFGFLAEAKIEEYGRGRPTIVTFQFAQTIQQVIERPDMFVTLDLFVLRWLNSKHSIALYETMKDYERLGQYRFPIEGFRKLMGIKAGQYSIFSMLKKRVLDVAINEINLKSDIQLSYTIEKLGRKVVGILIKLNLINDECQVTGTSNQISDKLKSFGINDSTIKKLIQRHDEQYLLANIAIVEEQVRKGKVNNASGYLLKAFQDDYRPTETEYSRSKTVLQQQHMEEQRAREDEEANERKVALAAKEEQKQQLLERIARIPEEELQKHKEEFYLHVQNNDILKRISDIKGMKDSMMQWPWLRFMEERLTLVQSN